ncbi:MAG: Holliday junction branch migration protein RuvA [Verrucomicrobia bacterium]|nr:Holliday junction branch migration protein RuvA [Verrucomicrobiota bacterium]
MISFIRGILVESNPTYVTVDVQGVGYEVQIPLSTYSALPAPGSEIKLLTQFIVREDAHLLFGFASRSERDMFRLLINSVSGIGPKIALSLLSGMTVNGIRGAVASKDVRALSSVSGVGKKTAERIVVELADKVGASGAWEASSAQRESSPASRKFNDAVLALMALGFKQPDAEQSVRSSEAVLGQEASVEELVRISLKQVRP